MKTRIGIGVAIACVIAVMIIVNSRQHPKQLALPTVANPGPIVDSTPGTGAPLPAAGPAITPNQPNPIAAGPIVDSTATPAAPTGNVAPPPELTPPVAPAPLRQTPAQQIAVQPHQAANSGLAQPLAREALSYVGVDPEAEYVWASAINDPSVPPEERQNLIEDLNEDGFDDPKNLTADDLPLIINRLILIEQFGPDSMDDVNAAAFNEAYKDLINMANRLTRS